MGEQSVQVPFSDNLFRAKAGEIPVWELAIIVAVVLFAVIYIAKKVK